MEYCGAGSVSDIIRLRRKTLTEDEVATVLTDTLKGLEYLHDRKKIHRDIKAGNILLNCEGHAKLADFGKFIIVCILLFPSSKPSFTDRIIILFYRSGWTVNRTNLSTIFNS